MLRIVGYEEFWQELTCSPTVTLLSQSMLEKENADPSIEDAGQKMLGQAAVCDPLGAGVDNYARRLIINDITQQLLEAVGLIHKKLGTGNRVRHMRDEEDEMAPVVKDVYSSTFPHLPGSNQRHLLHSPALQLVNTVTHVLSLHTAVEGAFMRRTDLKNLLIHRRRSAHAPGAATHAQRRQFQLID